MQKIPDYTKNLIRADQLSGLSYGKISLKYKVSQSQCYFICNPEKWAEKVKKQPKKTREANNKHVKAYRAKLKELKVKNSN